MTTHAPVMTQEQTIAARKADEAIVVTAQAEADRAEAAKEAAKPRFIINEIHPHSGNWNDQVERQNLETLAQQHNLAIGWKPVTPVGVPSPLALANMTPAERRHAEETQETGRHGPVPVSKSPSQAQAKAEAAQDRADAKAEQAREDRAEDAAAAKAQQQRKRA